MAAAQRLAEQAASLEVRSEVHAILTDNPPAPLAASAPVRQAAPSWPRLASRSSSSRSAPAPATARTGTFKIDIMAAVRFAFFDHDPTPFKAGTWPAAVWSLPPRPGQHGRIVAANRGAPDYQLNRAQVFGSCKCGKLKADHDDPDLKLPPC